MANMVMMVMVNQVMWISLLDLVRTGYSSEIGTKLREWAAATLGQHCPQMTQRPGMHLIIMTDGWTTINHETLPRLCD